MKISVENLNMKYSKDKKALQDVSIQIEGPGLIGILGPEGAGKSTFIKLLIGELQPTSGQILIDDVLLPKRGKKLKETLGYLPQSFGLYDELTLWQFLDYIAVLKGIENSRKVIKEVLQKTNLLEKQNAYISTLSDGERKLVGISQALMGSPELLVFDEPNTSLNEDERIDFRRLISQTAQRKLVLLSTQKIENVESICDGLIVIKNGEILFNGTPEQLIASVYYHAAKTTLKDAYIYLISGKEVTKH